MGYLSEQLKHYLEHATPEQLAQDRAILEKYAHVGPTLDEYFGNLESQFDVKIINEIASPEFGSLDFSFC